MASLILKPGREKSILRRHPWIFSGAILRVEGDPAPGETIILLSSTGQFLAQAAYSPHSQIQARIWTFDSSVRVDQDFFRRRITSSIQSRMGSIKQTNAYRLIHAESDGLPGLILDRYKDILVVQFLSAGAEYWKDAFVNLCCEVTGLRVIYERSDVEVRELEGLPLRTGSLAHSQSGSTASSLVADQPQILCPIITENDLWFKVDIQHGHKTGFYLDQRDNRLKVRTLAVDRSVLDCFCYTGGFSLNALAGGARSVLSVDSSAEALAACRENVLLNHLPVNRHQAREGDVFQLLRQFRDEGRVFNMIILDPPKFAPTAAQAGKAARGYKDINLLAFKLLAPGGLLFTFSCSGGVDASLFQKIIASAALDAGGEAQIVGYLSQAPDHPVALNFPEGTYLKGLICLKTSNQM